MNPWIDINDDHRLASGRHDRRGTDMSGQFQPRVPYFFTREGAEVNLIGMYRGTPAFLLCPGPSLAKVDLNLLRKPGVWTMTVNNAVKVFRGNAAITVDDPQRFMMSMWLDPSIQKFIPMCNFEKPLFDNRLVQDASGEYIQCWDASSLVPGDCPNVIGFRRNSKFCAETYLTEDTINWGNHENVCLCGFGERNKRGESCPNCGRSNAFGGRTVMLAALRILHLLGFRTVYLVGADFEMTKDKKYAFPEQRPEGAINCNNSTYAKMREWFSLLRPVFDRVGYQVYNTTMDSKLEAFDKVPFEDSVKNATEHIGGNPGEKCDGMYASMKDKLGLPQTPENRDITFAAG